MSDSDVNPIAKTLRSSPPDSRPQRPKSPKKKHTFHLLLLFALVAVACGLFLLIAVASFLKPIRAQADEFELSSLDNIESASIILDRNGKEFSRIYMLNRTLITIDQVQPHTINALVAQEDERFFSHTGVDFIGVMRAIWLNFKVGEETQGASTITQQLAREAFKLKQLENYKKSSRYNRKLVEWFLAKRIEKHYSKPQILELYLNRVYFGGGFYGIEAASVGYFGKHASDLSVGESALLCGIIKSPNNLQPIRFPDRAKNTRNMVLNRMYLEGFLSASDRDEWMATPVITAEKQRHPQDSYAFEAVRQEAMRIIGSEAALSGGFRIHTSIDAELQKVTEQAVRDHLSKIETEQPNYPHQTYEDYRKIVAQAKTNKQEPPQPSYLQGAALTIDNHTGAILAMVGGRSFSDSEYNRALQSKRPAGTAFTPFVYAAAFQDPKYFPTMEITDRPIDNRRVMIGGMTGILGEWGSENLEATTFQGEISAREALAQGRNSATAELGEKIGRAPVIELSKKLGIQSEIRDYPSSFLGSSEVRLDEMVTAYSALANKGTRPAALNLVTLITDSDGKIIYQKPVQAAPVRALDEIAAYQTHTALVEALREGTGAIAYTDYDLDDFPAAGKTGTHYEFKDLWFVGYSSEVTCGVWAGFDQQKTIYEGAFSNRVVLPIWVDIMNAANKLLPAKEITPPEEAQAIEVCKTSGHRATDGCYIVIKDPISGADKAIRNTRFEYLRKGTFFEIYCEEHPRDATQLLAPRFGTPNIQNRPNAVGETITHIRPIRMLGPTLIGLDPFNTVLPIVKAEPVNEDGTQVIRAVPVEEPESESPIKLATPPPLLLE